MSVRYTIILLTIAVILAAGTLSLLSLYVSFPYSKETVNWQVQSTGQDLVNLSLILPFLSVSTLLLLKEKPYGPSLWAGSVLYLVYTYAIYCFNIHFNPFFIGYCFILGTCFYLFVYFFWQQIRKKPVKINRLKYHRPTAVFFMTIAIIFAVLWLKDIVPYLKPGVSPQSLKDTGLFTNPVHVLDLAVFLPGTFITGLLLLKQRALGFILTPVLLTFMILMETTIAGLTIIMNKNGVQADLSVVAVMIVLALISSILLFLNLSNNNYESTD